MTSCRSRAVLSRLFLIACYGAPIGRTQICSHTPDEGDLVDFIPRIAQTAELQRKLLVDNPMGLLARGVRQLIIREIGELHESIGCGSSAFGIKHLDGIKEIDGVGFSGRSDARKNANCG